MRRLLLLFISVLLMIPLLSSAEEAAVIPPDWLLLGSAGNTASAIRRSRSEADIFMDSLTDVMREELVRSVLSENDELILARMLWGEDRENPMFMRAAIIWCVFNRMDQSRLPIEQLINQTQFPGYREENPVKDWAIDLIRAELHLKSGTQVQSMSKAERDEALRVMKERGISVRQIERLTGINRGAIQRA